MASSAPAPPAGAVIVGGGLAGSLLALALREHGLAVRLIDAPASTPLRSATAISYGALPGWPLTPTPLGRLAAGAARRWRRLQRQHGDLGWRPRRLRLAARPLPLPCSQVDTAVLMPRLPAVLAAAGVECWSLPLQQMQREHGRWVLSLADGSRLHTSQLVLAAGAHCRELWPALPERVRTSWAAVLELADGPPPQGAAALWLPARFARVELERRAATLEQPQWLVDPGLAPWGTRALLGQHTLVRPGLPLGPAPAAQAVEQQLRQALAAQTWSAPLAGLPGSLRQAPVAFCCQGLPLVGPVAAAPGLWLFTGFSAGFAQVPVLAPLLASAVAAVATGAARHDLLARLAHQAEQRLRTLQVWPNTPDGG